MMVTADVAGPLSPAMVTVILVGVRVCEGDSNGRYVIFGCPLRRGPEQRGGRFRVIMEDEHRDAFDSDNEVKRTVEQASGQK